MLKILEKIYLLCFYIGVFLIPFNSFEGVEELGEFRKESAAYFFLLGFVVVLLYSLKMGKIYFPYKNKAIHIFILFLAWLFVSFLFNIDTISDNFYKKTPGINRFIRQFASLIISSIIFFYLYWNVVRQMTVTDMLYKIRKGILYSFIFVSVYGFLEIAYVVFGFYPAYTVLRMFDYFPFTEFDQHLESRISSVSYEPPFLAIYLITVAGWMFSYIATSKSIFRFIPTLAILILTYYSGSRTALIVVLVQIFIFLLFITSVKDKIRFAKYGAGIIFILFSLTIAFNSERIIYDIEKKAKSLDFKGNLKKNISNQSRFGIQYANFQVFKDSPIIGVGFGQQAYTAVYYYPAWAKKNNYEFEAMYLNKNDPMFPPGYNLYVRLLAETGLIGFLLFILFLSYLIKNVFYNAKKGITKDIRILNLILLVSFAGFTLNWLQVDTFRTYGFWIYLAIFAQLFTLSSLRIELKKE